LNLGTAHRRALEWTWNMTAIVVVLLLFLGLAAGSLFVALAWSARERSRRVPSSAELLRVRRRAEARAYREAELAELRSQGPLIDRDDRNRLGRVAARAAPGVPIRHSAS
jgi:hypothetical protein